MILLLFHETEPPSILTSMFVSFVVGKETNHGAARDLMPYQHASNWRAQERTLYGKNRPKSDTPGRGTRRPCCCRKLP